MITKRQQNLNKLLNIQKTYYSFKLLPMTEQVLEENISPLNLVLLNMKLLIYPGQIGDRLKENIMENLKKRYEGNSYNNEGILLKIRKLITKEENIDFPISRNDMSGIISTTVTVECLFCSLTVGQSIICSIPVINIPTTALKLNKKIIIIVRPTRENNSILQMYSKDKKSQKELENVLFKIKIIKVVLAQGNIYFGTGDIERIANDDEVKSYYIDEYKVAKKERL